MTTKLIIDLIKTIGRVGDNGERFIELRPDIEDEFRYTHLVWGEERGLQVCRDKNKEVSYCSYRSCPYHIKEQIDEVVYDMYEHEASNFEVETTYKSGRKRSVIITALTEELMWKIYDSRFNTSLIKDSVIVDSWGL